MIDPPVEQPRTRCAKIAATLGPACDDERTLERMIRGGMDVARLNFSHGDTKDHLRRVRRLRRVSRSIGRDLAVLADMQGPRFRVGRLPDGGVHVADGDRVKLLAGRDRADDGDIPVSYAALARDVGRGDRVLIDDGNIELRVSRVRGETVHCEVVRGGRIGNNKGINLPGAELSAPALTAKDKRDLRSAVEMGADWLAVSFVRTADDIVRARRLTERAGRRLPVMAKIELPQAIDHLDEIIDASDALLVARGDLGVELPPEDVPLLQKRIIERAMTAGKPTVTATQMLDSMRRSPRPTRAEASDVANAVIDGSDCLLLTAETAAGEFPAESIEMMDRIIRKAESSERVPRRVMPDGPGSLPVALATCLAGCRTAYECGARYLVVFTQSGFSARLTARFRPRTPILAFAAEAEVVRQLRVVWGVRPRKVPAYRSIETMLVALERAVVREKLAVKGDLVVMLAGSPVGVAGTTNLMEIHEIGTPIHVPRAKKKAKRA